MESKDIIMLISEISVGAVLTFLAIMLWSHTREVEWMLIIVGVIVKYGQIIILTLTMLGVVSSDLPVIPGVVDVNLILKILPDIFFIAAFIVHLTRIMKGVES